MDYPTRPLESWNEAAELRKQIYQDITQAKEKGKVLVAGGTAVPYELMGGFGDFELVAGETWGGNLAADDAVSTRCLEALEAHGYGKEGCGYYRLFLGSMFLNYGPFGAFPRPDIVVQINACDSQGKAAQIVSERYGIPGFCFDIPLTTFMELSSRPDYVEFMASQYSDFITWAEKALGRRFDDGRFIETVYNATRTLNLWGQIVSLNKTIPAPLDERHLFTLFTPMLLGRHKLEVVRFHERLLAEVQGRVRDGVSALGVEKMRLLHEGQPPWYALNLLRYPAKYGAVVVGSFYTFCIALTPFAVENGRWQPLPSPRENGVVLKSRDDAVRFLARWYLEAQFFKRLLHVPGKLDVVPSLARDWGAKGVIIHLNRGCPGYTIGNMELKTILQEQGIAAVTYEGSMADRREFSSTQVNDRFDAFFESLGLRRGDS
ncbi:MAG: 2-hydroxyacyl-CoA dehydratase [Chloroflexi bacterium]|nr:2-hydroxyacyl-CoA dehydratase [Chloroflexota bacterium]